MSKIIVIENRKDIEKPIIELISILNRDNRYTIYYYRNKCNILGCDFDIEYVDNKYQICYNNKLILRTDNKNIVSAYVRSRI